jgi:hypothetical protein
LSAAKRLLRVIWGSTLRRFIKPVSGISTTVVRYARDTVTGDTFIGIDKLTWTFDVPLTEAHRRGMQSAGQASQVSSRPSSPSPHADTRVGVGVTEGVAVAVGGAGVNVSVGVGSGSPHTE